MLQDEAHPSASGIMQCAAMSSAAWRDKDWLLTRHRRARRDARKRDGALVLWPPRLTDFPPQLQRISAGELLEDMRADSLSFGEVHLGRKLHLKTISEPSLCGNSVDVVAEDLDGIALRLVMHYLSVERTLAAVAEKMPNGTHICVKEPYFQDFRNGGPAVCCAQPANLVFHSGGGEAPLSLKREAVNDLPQQGTTSDLQPHSERTAKEGQRGDYDFLALHEVDASGPSRFPCASYLNPRVAVVQLADRGKGVVTQEALSVGELVMGSKAEHILFHNELAGQSLCRAPDWDEDGLDCAADTLLAQCLAKDVLTNAEHRAALLGLSHGVDQSTPDDPTLLQLLRVVKTNRFTACQPWDGPTRGTGLWLNASRLNHACDANCSWCTIGDMMFIRCQRPIAVGEELTIPYCSPTDSVEDRRNFLRSRHGFTCHCNLCEAQSAGAHGAEEYCLHVAKAERCQAQRIPDWKAVLFHTAAAFEFLSLPAYSSQRQAQTEHGIAASKAGQRLGQPETAQFWLQRAKASFALQWGGNPDVFNLYATRCGVIGADLG
mmetsp:Transcript_103100/g.204749  ORF Transcript_103100/g.204749 Transcript_103100/m.204749 type:complete len:548 (+) Transcript_103100:92-1735(+)